MSRASALRLPTWAWSLLGLATVAAAWTLVTNLGWVTETYLPSPQRLGGELLTLLERGYRGAPLHEHIGISLWRTLSGFAVGALLGVPLGLFTGHNRTAGALVAPLVAFLRPIPPIAFIPMAVLYFGLGETGKVVLIAFTAFNYAQLNAHAGAAGVPESYLRAARSMGLSERQIFWRVIVPAAVPQIFTGLKVAMALSWAVVVAAELVGAQRGIGFMISDAAQLFRIPVVFIGIACIGVIGLLLNAALNALQCYLVHWERHA